MIGDFFAIFSIAYKGVSEICHLHTNLMMSACDKLNLHGGPAFADAVTLTQPAIEAAVPVAERRIVQAGLRIADYLDAAFAPGPLPQPEGRP